MGIKGVTVACAEKKGAPKRAFSGDYTDTCVDRARIRTISGRVAPAFVSIREKRGHGYVDKAVSRSQG